MEALSGGRSPYWMQFAVIDRRVVGPGHPRCRRRRERQPAATRRRRPPLGSPNSTTPTRSRRGVLFRRRSSRVERPSPAPGRVLQVTLESGGLTGRPSPAHQGPHQRRCQGLRDDQSNDFSEAPVVVDLRAVAPVEVDLHAWQQTARTASEVLLGFEHIYDSNVSYRLEDDVHLLVASNGTQIRFQRPQARVSVWATTVADDGMQLSVYDYVDVTTASKLPDREAIEAMARRVGEQVEALRNAPLVDPYNGPHPGGGHRPFLPRDPRPSGRGHRQKDEDKARRSATRWEAHLSFLRERRRPDALHLGGAELLGTTPTTTKGSQRSGSLG